MLTQNQGDCRGLRSLARGVVIAGVALLIAALASLFLAGRASASTLSHPAGCPRVAFCGCGAAVEVFGRPVRDLWLAANWFRFPPASAAPGMVAVRQHHIVVIRQALPGNKAIVYDANSGHHMTQIHEVSLAGYSIRNPHRGG